MPRPDSSLAFIIEVEAKSIDAKRPGAPVDLMFLELAYEYRVQMTDKIWHPCSSSQKREVDRREGRKKKGGERGENTLIRLFTGWNGIQSLLVTLGLGGA